MPQFHSPERIINLKKVLSNGYFITEGGTICALVRVSGVTPHSFEDHIRVQSLFESAVLRSLDFPIQLVAVNKKYNPNEHLNYWANNVRDDLLPKMATLNGSYKNYAKAFRDVLFEREYYVVVPAEGGAVGMPAELSPVDSARIGIAEQRAKMKENYEELRRRVNLVIGGLSAAGLRPQAIDKRADVLNIFRILFNPSEYQKLGAEQVEEKDDASVSLIEVAKSESVSEDVKKQAQKETRLGFAAKRWWSQITGVAGMNVPLRGRGLLRGDANIVAPNYMDLGPDHCIKLPDTGDMRPGYFVPMYVNQFPADSYLARQDVFGVFGELNKIQVPYIISVHITPVDQKKAKQKLMRETRKTQSNLMAIGELKQIGGKDVDDVAKEAAATDELYQKTVDSDKLFFVSMYLGFYAPDPEKIESVSGEIGRILRTKGFSCTLAYLSTIPALHSIMPFCENKMMVMQMHTPRQASKYMVFSPESYIAPHGIFWGVNSQDGAGMPMCYEPIGQENQHITIFAPSGGGKTALIQSMVTRTALLKNRRQFVIDFWGGNYSGYNPFADDRGAQVINLGQESRQHINPCEKMRIRDPENPGQHHYETTADILQRMRGLYALFMQDQIGNVWSLASSQLELLYGALDEMDDHRPIYLKDHCALFEQKYQAAKDTDPLDAGLYHIIKSRLVGFINHHLFTHATNVDIENPLLIYNLGDGVPGGGSNIYKEISAFVCLNHTWTFINLYKKHVGNKDINYIYLDECGFMMKYRDVASYVSEVMKAGRNFDTGLILADQTVSRYSEGPAAEAWLNPNTKIYLKQSIESLGEIQKLKKIGYSEDSGAATELPESVRNYLLTCNAHVENTELISISGVMDVKPKNSTQKIMQFTYYIVPGEMKLEYSMNSETIKKTHAAQRLE